MNCGIHRSTGKARICAILLVGLGVIALVVSLARAQNMSVQPVLAQPPGKIRVAKPILGAAGRKASARPGLAVSGRPSVITAGTYAFSLASLWLWRICRVEQRD